MAVVRLDGLTKRFDRGGRAAAEDVTLEIGDGELMVLLGPSGCGKTTTLRMIAGLETITSGTLSIDGRVVNAVPAKDRDIAMVFQSYALYPHMSVADNLAFGLRRRGFAREEIERRVAGAAATLGLTELLARKPHALSGGQRQRVALGRAIVRDPKVFLFDEPLSNLDAALRVSTRGEIAAMHQRLGATMIYVTHDQVEAMTLGTRICIMSEGRVVQVGAPLDVYREPANTFVAGFLGSPPMNLVRAMADGSGDACRLRLGTITFELPSHRAPQLAPAGSVWFGIRPEHASIGARPERPQIATLDGEVSQIERLGAETIVFTRLVGHDGRIVVRAAGGLDGLAIGARCPLHLDLSHAHVFDADGGRMPQSSKKG